MTNPYLDLVARLETRGGEATIKGPQGEDSNNLFNIKETRAGKSGYRAKDKAEGSNDAYRVYGSKDESVADMESLLARRYPEAFDAMQKSWSPESVTEFAQGLKKRGYATDPAYVEKLVKLSNQVDGTGYAGKSDKMTGINRAVSEVVNSYVIRPVDERLSNARREAANFNQRIVAETQPTLFESFGAAMAGNTDQQFAKGIRDSLFSPKYPEEAGYVPDVNLIPDGADAHLVNDIKTAKSRAEVDALLADHSDEQTRQRAVMANGTGMGIALSFAAEVPTLSNLLPSVAAAKAAKLAGYANSLSMLQEGRKGAMVGAAIAENVASGTVVEALRQGVTGDYSLQDMGLAMAADVTFGLGTSALAMRSGERTLLARAQDTELGKYTGFLQEAERKLGPSATAEDLRKYADDKYTKEVEDIVRAADTHEVPKERRLLDVAEDSPPNAMEQVDAGASGSSMSAIDKSVYDAYPPRAKFESGGSLTRWEANFEKGGDFADEIAGYTGGKYNTLEDLKALAPGIHASGALKAETKQTVAAMQSLAKRFMPDMSLTVHFDLIPHGKSFAHAKVGQVNDKIAMIVIDPTLAPSQMVRAAVHEMGHVVFNRGVEKANKAELAGIKNAFNEFRAEASNKSPDGNKARAMRFSVTNVDQQATLDASEKLVSNYHINFDEYAAEQFVKYTEKNMERLGLADRTIKMLREAIDRVMRLFRAAKREAIDVDTAFESFFESLLDGKSTASTGGDMLSSGPLSQMSVPTTDQVKSVASIQQDPNVARLGLSTLPVATDADRATVKQLTELHRRAEEWAVKNPMDAEYTRRVQNLADNNVFNVASAGLIMLKSDSPLVRMIASELLEDASGVQKGRRDTAAIAKFLTERAIMGNALNDYENAYSFWKKGKKDAGLWDDMVGGKYKAEFDKAVASEIEARRISKQPVTTDANVKAAADVLEAGYTRAANQQRKAKTLGWASLPESSVGYMPHKMSPRAVMALTNSQQQVLHSALTDQFVTIEGWDASFADELASKYMKRIRDRAAGDYSSTVGGNTSGAADIVQDALIAMNLSSKEIKAHMANYTKGAANFTKSRIDLDLNRVYDTEDGPFRLLDIFETNHTELLRAQAGRVSGEVALAKYGVYGKPGLQLLRDAMRYGQDGKKASMRDLESFDQIAAEFMNEPFGTQGGKLLERAMAANTLVRMGGIVFNQLAETVNGVFHVGALRTAESVASIPRLRSEIKALARGEAVENPIIGSIELVGGAEFGTDSYKFVMPYDSPDHAYPTYGKDTLTVTDRLLRGGNHLQSKLSGWRMIHSAQQRGMAEQIVHKMMRYVRTGGDDVALRDFGITPEVQAYLRENLDKIATFDGDRLVRFEADKLPDSPMRDQVIQSVWRGTQQIIQGTFIGERGKWAHDGFLKLLTQFRSFSITSMEKQWGRQRNQRGGYAAFGMAMGAMSMVWPIYAARVYANSIGRPDQEEYIDKQLTPQNVARASLNYIAMSGLAGDFIDTLTAVAPDSVKEATGFNPMGSTGKEADLVGNYVLPAAGLANDAFKWLQSPTEIQDAAKILPLSRLPYLVPLMNTTKD
jgi:hypothetical protein